MANAYPIVRSSFLGTLSHPFNFDNKIENNTLLLETRAFGLFRQFLALKIAVPFAFVSGIHWPFGPITIAILFVVFAAGFSRHYLFGLTAILGLAFLAFLRSWPFTINHVGLELGIVLLMCLMPEDESQSLISIANLIKFLMLSVWFYSGIHKLLDGYYWNGEFFALEALSNQTPLGHHLNQILHFFASFFGSQTKTLSCCTQGVIAVTQWQTAFLLTISWLTILGEILIPLSFLIPKFRPFSIVCLFVFQGIIAYFSGEIDFAFTAFAILFLFIPKYAHILYPTLACLLLMVQPWT